jgi:hypothetical protein
VGVGRWEGPVSSGLHTIKLSARGKKSYQTELLVGDNESRELRISLEPEPEAKAGGVPTWAWITGGVIVAGAAAAVGGYFLFRPKDEPAPPLQVGTIQPGTVQIPLSGFGR